MRQSGVLNWTSLSIYVYHIKNLALLYESWQMCMLLDQSLYLVHSLGELMVSITQSSAVGHFA